MTCMYSTLRCKVQLTPASYSAAKVSGLQTLLCARCSPASGGPVSDACRCAPHNNQAEPFNAIGGQCKDVFRPRCATVRSVISRTERPSRHATSRLRKTSHKVSTGSTTFLRSHISMSDMLRRASRALKDARYPVPLARTTRLSGTARQ